MSANILKYRNAFEISQAILDIAGIDEFPINLDDLFSSKKGAPILVSSMEDYNAWMFKKHPGHWSPLFVLDAKCFYYPDRNAYMIVYNEARPETRIRFSLAHELAHIVLGHLDDDRTEVCRGGVEDPIYYAMEGAANTFAGNFLAPPILIDYFLAGGPFDAQCLSIRFDVSPSAMRDYRAEDYKYWKTLTPNKHEKALLERCSPLFHLCICAECGATFSIEGAMFCPICGANSSNFSPCKKEATKMVYPHIGLTEKGHVKECLICKNEEHVEGADFCMICGSPIVNHCIGALAENVPLEYTQCSHDEPLPGNARFCPYCGSRTSFFKEKVLTPWDEEDGSPLPF